MHQINRNHCFKHKDFSNSNTRISLTLIFTGPDSGLHVSTSNERPEEFEEQLKEYREKGNKQTNKQTKIKKGKKIQETKPGWLSESKK